MKRLLSFILLASVSAFGANVHFAYQDSISRDLKNRFGWLSPAQTNVTTAIISLETIKFQYDANGEYTLSNVVAGAYTLTNSSTPLTILSLNVPDTNATVEVTNIIGVAIPAPGTVYGYTVAEANSKFIAKDSGTGTNLTLYGTNTFTSGITFGGETRTNWPSSAGVTINGTNGIAVSGSDPITIDGAGLVGTNTFTTATNDLYTAIGNAPFIASTNGVGTNITLNGTLSGTDTNGMGWILSGTTIAGNYFTVTTNYLNISSGAGYVQLEPNYLQGYQTTNNYVVSGTSAHGENISNSWKILSTGLIYTNTTGNITGTVNGLKFMLVTNGDMLATTNGVNASISTASNGLASAISGKYPLSGNPSNWLDAVALGDLYGLTEYDGVDPKTTLGIGSSAGVNSVALGDSAQAGSNGIGIGSAADASSGGVAIGSQAQSVIDSTALNSQAYGYQDSVAVGAHSTSTNSSVAVGNFSTAYESAISIGTYSSAQATNSIAIGSGIWSDNTSGAKIPTGWNDTTEIGNGTATLRGGFNFRGYGIISSNGVVVPPALASTNGLSGTNILAVLPGGTNFWTAIPSGGSGEANTAASLGGGYQLTAGKSGTVLNFNTISNNETTPTLLMSSNANRITIRRAAITGDVSIPTNSNTATIAAAVTNGFVKASITNGFIGTNVFFNTNLYAGKLTFGADGKVSIGTNAAAGSFDTNGNFTVNGQWVFTNAVTFNGAVTNNGNTYISGSLSASNWLANFSGNLLITDANSNVVAANLYNTNLAAGLVGISGTNVYIGTNASAGTQTPLGSDVDGARFGITNLARLRMAYTNIWATNTSVLLNLAQYNNFKVVVSTNVTFTFTNASPDIFNSKVLLTMDTNGGYTTAWTCAGGLIRTNASLQASTNAGRSSILEVMSDQDQSSTNLFCWYPKDFVPDVIPTNTIAAGGGGCVINSGNIANESFEGSVSSGWTQISTGSWGDALPGTSPCSGLGTKSLGATTTGSGLAGYYYDLGSMSTTTYYWRFYLYVDSSAQAATDKDTLFAVAEGPDLGAYQIKVQLNSTGSGFQIFGNSTADGTIDVSLATWYRVEVKTVYNGACEIHVYNAAGTEMTGSPVNETIGGGNQARYAHFGILAKDNTANATAHFDGFGVSTTGFLGQ